MSESIDCGDLECAPLKQVKARLTGGGMVGNPFNEERQQQLQNDATDLLEKFSIQFLKSYGFALFNKIKEEIEGEEDDPRKLKYRDWNDVERPELFSGECYMRSGGGPGDFGGWKKVFIAETQDYNLHVYPNAKAYENKKKPKMTISVAGYALKRHVTYHFEREMSYLARGLGLTEVESKAMTIFSNYSFALTHGQRTNYIFQLHSESGGGCFSCAKAAVDPDGGAEMAEECDRFIEAFDRCVNNASARSESVISNAFNDTVSKLSDTLPNLSGWSSDGSESEILTEMLMQQCLPGIRDGMLDDLAGPVSIRLGVWYKTQALIHKTLSALAKPAWAGMEKGAGAAGEKIEPVVRKGVQPILAALEKAKSQLKSAVNDKIGGILAKAVSPHLKPVFDCLDAPLNKGFQLSRGIYENKVVVSALPGDEKTRNTELDAIPRTYANVCEMQQASHDLVRPLQALKNISEEVFGEIDAFSLRSQAEVSLLTTLDAAVYTLELKISEEGMSDSHKARILEDYDHDVILAKAAFTKEVMRSILMANFQKLCAPIVDPVISTVDGVIPEDLHDILSAQAAWDELVEIFVGGPIDEMVDAAYPTSK